MSAPTLSQRCCYSSTKRQHNNVSSERINRQRCMDINKAIVNCRDTGNYKLLERIIRKNIEHFDDVNVATSFSVLAKLKTNSGVKHIDKELIHMLIFEMDDLSGYKQQALANITWSIVKLGDPIPKQLVARYNNITQDELKRFNPQGLSNSIWAFAISGLPVPHEFSKCLMI